MIVPLPAFKIRVSAVEPVVPVVVPEIVILPIPTDPCVDKITLRVSAIVNVPPILKVVFVVVILLAKLAAPEVENPPGATIAPVADNVNNPELVTAIAPVVVKLLLTLKIVPLSVAEPTLTVFEKVVVPVAAFVWLKAPVIAIALLKFITPELMIVTVVNPVVSALVPDP